MAQKYSYNKRSEQAVGLVSFSMMDGAGSNGILDLVDNSIFDTVGSPVGKANFNLGGRGFRYDGGSNYHMHPNNTKFELTDVTIGAIFTPFVDGASQEAFATIIAKEYAISRTQPFDSYKILMNNTGGSVDKFSFAFSTGGNVHLIDSTTVATAFNTYWIYATLSGTTGDVNLYVNGNFEILYNGGITEYSDGRFFVAANEDGGENCNGIVHEYRVYNRILSANEIFRIYSPKTRWDLYTTHLYDRFSYGSGGESAIIPQNNSVRLMEHLNRMRRR